MGDNMKKYEHGGNIYEHQNINDYSANTNYLGLPKNVCEAIITSMSLYQKYPDPNCTILKQKLAAYHHVSDNKIVCGNGCAEIIDKIALVLKPKRALIIVPTFSEYEKSLEMTNTKIDYYYLKQTTNFNLQSDILNRLTSEIDIMYLCNPNNPTGLIVPSELLLRIACKCLQQNITLVVDECFMDFVKNNQQYSLINTLALFPNLIILKAFTKIYAMAGIRLGYCLCGDKNLAKQLDNILQPWSVSAIAQSAGVVALDNFEYVQTTIKNIAINRKYLYDELTNLGFKVVNSTANFLLFQCSDAKLYDKLLRQGFLIRRCKNFEGLDEYYYRIAVKSHSDNQSLIAAIKQVL